MILQRVYEMIFFMKDDQQAFVRFSLMAPHILTVDMPRLVKSNRSVRKSSLLGNHTLTTDYGEPMMYMYIYSIIPHS